MNDKKMIITDQDFHMAMESVKSSIQLLGLYDWQALVHQIAFFEGAGAVIHPTIFTEMQKDPQWEQKKQILAAAADFVAKIEDVQRQLTK